jgi:hypothetical protein
LLCGFHDETTPPVTAAPRRTVANLLDEAARTRAEEATWAHVEQMIGTHKSDVYHDAVRLLTDLQATGGHC